MQVTEESLAYTKVDFLGDFGGYVGMFVGASVVTIYDMIVVLLDKTRTLIEKLQKSQKHQKLNKLLLLPKNQGSRPYFCLTSTIC